MSFLGSPSTFNAGRARSIAVATVQAYAAPLLENIDTSATLDPGQLATITSDVTAAVSAVALVPTNSSSITVSDGVGTTNLSTTATTIVFSVPDGGNTAEPFILADGTSVGQMRNIIADSTHTEPNITVQGTFRDAQGNSFSSIIIATGTAATFIWTSTGWQSTASGSFSYA